MTSTDITSAPQAPAREYRVTTTAGEKTKLASFDVVATSGGEAEKKAAEILAAAGVEATLKGAPQLVRVMGAKGWEDAAIEPVALPGEVEDAIRDALDGDPVPAEAIAKRARRAAKPDPKPGQAKATRKAKADESAKAARAASRRGSKAEREREAAKGIEQADVAKADAKAADQTAEAIGKGMVVSIRPDELREPRREQLASVLNRTGVVRRILNGRAHVDFGDNVIWWLGLGQLKPTGETRPVGRQPKAEMTKTPKRGKKARGA